MLPASLPHAHRTIATVVVGVSIALVTGCGPRANAGPVVIQSIPYQQPIVTPKGNGMAEDASVRVIFSPKEAPSKTFTAVVQLEEPFMANTVVLNGQKSYDVKRQRVTLPYPAQDFSARITNSSTSAVRLSNAVVTYTFNGSVINLDQSRFEKFVKIVVPPQGTAEITVPGVLTRDLGDGELEVGLFDVSVGEKKGNFKVIFQVKTKASPIEVVETTTDEKMNEFDKAMMTSAAQSQIAGFQNLIRNWSNDLKMYENDTWKPTPGQIPGLPMMMGR